MAKIMAKNKIQILLTTEYDEEIPFTLVFCEKGVIGGIYFIEKEDCSGFAYHIQNKNGWWYEKTFEKELDAIRFMVQNSFLMNFDYKVISVKLSDYWNSERGAITYRDNIESVNLVA